MSFAPRPLPYLALCAGCVLLGCASAPHANTQATSSSEPAREAAAALRFVSPYSYAWFARAEVLRARGEHDAAVAAYRHAQSAADDDPYLYARLASALEHTGDREAADAALERALQLDAYSEAAWLASGEIALQRGEHALAYESFERAESAAPHSPSAPLALSRLLYASGHDARALQVLTRYASRQRRSAAETVGEPLSQALERGDPPDEISRLLDLWLSHAPNDPALFRRMAHKLVEAGRAAAALRLLQRLPRERRGALELELLITLGRFDEAELRIATTAPEDLGGPLQMAEMLLRIDRPSPALELIAEVPEEHEPHRAAALRARALLARGDAGAAALSAARVPARSRHRAAATQTLRHALQSGGLQALAAELQSAAPDSTSE